MPKRKPPRPAGEKIAALEAQIAHLKAVKKTRAEFSASILKKERERLDLSAGDYARLVGVAQITIYSWEYGRCRPSADQLPKWLAVKGIPKETAWKKLGLDDASDFSAKAVLAERERLGLSQRNYAKLVGVGTLAIFNWEHGMCIPNGPSLEKWRAVKGIGKAKAEKKLGRA